MASHNMTDRRSFVGSSPINFQPFIVLSLLVVMAVVGAVSSAGANGLNYAGTIEAHETADGTVKQSHAQNAGLSLSQIITNYIIASEQVRYSTAWQEGGVRRDIQSENLDLVDDNQIFRANLSGASTTNFTASKEQTQSESYQFGFKGKWASVYPVLAMVVSRSVDSSEILQEKSGATLVDTTLDWSWSSLAFYYNYTVSEPDSKNAKNEEHTATVGFADSYLHNKLRVSFNHSYSLKRQEFRVIGSSFELPIYSSEIRIGPDSTPLNNIEDTVPDNVLRDGDYDVTGYTVTANSTYNNIMIVANGQTVNRIYLYTHTAFPGLPLGLKWSLYTTETLVTGWNDASSYIAGITYNIDRHRFEIELSPLAANYVKVGLDYLSLSGPVIDFSEVSLFNSGFVPNSTAANEKTDNATSLYVSGVLSQTLRIDYRLSAVTEEATGNSSFKTEELSQSSSLSYSSADLADSARFLVGLRNKAETESTNYSLSYNHVFLPTLQTKLSWSRVENSFSSSLVAVSSGYSVESTARLYPDLEMRLNIGSQEAWTLVNNNRNYRESKSLDCDLTARLWPGLTMAVHEVVTKLEIPVSGWSFSTGASLQWTISRWLAVNQSVRHQRGSLAPELASLTLGTSIDFALTDRASLATTYNYRKVAKDGAAAEGGGVSLRWAVKSGIGLNTGVSYTKNDPTVQNEAGPAKEYLSYIKLSANFNVP